MTQTKIKKIPFDLELAKKITNKEIKGNIVARNGYKARIICFDRKETDDIFDPPKNIIALVTNKDGSEGVFAVRDDGMILLTEETDHDLQIEVPTYYRDYSNFVPQKWQPCLVRDNENHLWGVQVYSHTNCQGKMLFYDDEGYVRPYAKVLPLSKVTARLIGTTKSYEELIEELDTESTKKQTAMNIAEILKHCPKGTKLYSLVDGEVSLQNICNTGQYRIEVSVNDWTSTHFTEDGKLFANRPNGECVLFPSKEQRDWSKFGMSEQDTNTRPKPQFKPFDKVLVRDGDNDRWQPAFFSVLKEDSAEKFGVIDGYIPTFYSQCIPYNDDTKHLLGTYDPYKPKA